VFKNLREVLASVAGKICDTIKAGMNTDPAAERNASRPGEGIRGVLVGCVLIAAIGIIAVFPWAYNLPYTYIHEFKYHYWIEFPAQVLQVLPAGFPSGIPIRPPRYVILPPNLKAIGISLVVTSLACLVFVILYALRWTLPSIVRLALGLISFLLLAVILISICRWLFTPITMNIALPR
jgi:hypothetical protein